MKISALLAIVVLVVLSAACSQKTIVKSEPFFQEPVKQIVKQISAEEAEVRLAEISRYLDNGPVKLVPVDNSHKYVKDSPYKSLPGVVGIGESLGKRCYCCRFF